jgi:peptidoglycan/LPS O-acetylase OafA/YrhL
MRERHAYIDAWRAAALARVVVYHVLGYAWLTVLFPAMGVMFGLGGSLMARSLDRTAPGVVRSRARRLLPSLWALGAVAVPVMIATGWRQAPATPLGWAELLWWLIPLKNPPGGGEWAWSFTVMLWYLVTYLWLVLLSPALLMLFRRWPWPVLVVSLVLPVAMDLGVLAPGGYLSEPVWSAGTYACCWVIGFAHRDGLLRAASDTVFFAAVAVLAVAGAGSIAWYGLRTGVFDVNHVPVGKSLWSAAFVAAVLRFEPRMEWLRRTPRLARLIQAMNARAVTIYLWHVPSGIVAVLLVAPLGLRGGAWYLALLAGVALLTALSTFLFGWIEDLSAARSPRLVPWPRPRSGSGGRVTERAEAHA